MVENINDNILQAAIPAAITFIFSITYFFITNYSKQKKEKDRREILIKFLCSDKHIDECIQQYKKIDSPKELWVTVTMFLGSLLGSFYYIFFLIITLIVFKTFNSINSWSPVYPTLIVFFISCIATVIIYFYIEKTKRDKTLLDKSGRIGYFIVLINWFIFTSFFSALFFLAIAQTRNLDIVTNNWLYVSVSLLIGSIAFQYENRTNFKNYSKFLLTSKYLYKFPYVHITTKSFEIEGKISEIFDENLINLDFGRFREGVEWDTITRLKLRKF